MEARHGQSQMLGGSPTRASSPEFLEAPAWGRQAHLPLPAAGCWDAALACCSQCDCMTAAGEACHCGGAKLKLVVLAAGTSGQRLRCGGRCIMPPHPVAETIRLGREQPPRKSPPKARVDAALLQGCPAAPTGRLVPVSRRRALRHHHEATTCNECKVP